MLDPFGQALTARNVAVDESKKKKKKLYPSRPLHSVSLITNPLVPSYFLKKYDYDDDDNITAEFATSCPLLVL